MGKWSQYRHRGGGGRQTANLQAPVLSFDGIDTLSWTWAIADPTSWELWVANPPTDPFVLNTTVPGADRAMLYVDSPTKVFLRGVDGGGSAVTLDSNVVDV
jgi:hypothetical protein